MTTELHRAAPAPPQVPAPGADDPSTALGRWTALALGVAGGTVLPGWSTFVDLAPPLFDWMGVIAAAGAAAIFFAFHRKGRAAAAGTPGRAFRCILFALALLVAYSLLLHFWTEVPPAQREGARIQIGFGLADWSLTDEALRLRAPRPDGLGLETANDLLLAFGVWGGSGKATEIWKTWTWVLAGSILIVLFVMAVLAWAYGWALVAQAAEASKGTGAPREVPAEGPAS